MGYRKNLRMKKVLFPKRYVGGGWERRQLFYMKQVDNRKRNDEKSLFKINFYFTAYLPDVCRPNQTISQWKSHFMTREDCQILLY